MKKQELQNCIESLKNIRAVSDKLDYNDSVSINQNLIKVLPILEKEFEKMDQNKVEVNSPRIKIITMMMAEEVGLTLEEFTNNYMESLKEQNLEIIDFDYRYLSEVKPYVIVKYTN